MLSSCDDSPIDWPAPTIDSDQGQQRIMQTIQPASGSPPVGERHAHHDDFVSIRGVRVDLSTLLNESMLEPAGIEALRQQFVQAQPYPHLVIEGLFDPTLLELIHAEFDLLEQGHWKVFQDAHHNTNRLRDGTRWGPASQLYFNLVNSGAFVTALSAITGIDALIGDPYLAGGGLHETKAGGKFAMHTDFNKHVRTRLDNEMVMMTYLNKDWDAAYEGALELWDVDTRECVRSILPTFGRTVILKHSARSLHGHPHPLAPPPGRTRRSVASYYYTNRRPNDFTVDRHPSKFLPPDNTSLKYRLKTGARQVTPPLVWTALGSLVKAARKPRP